MASWAFSGNPRAASDSGVSEREGVVEKRRIIRDMNGGMMDESGSAMGWLRWGNARKLDIRIDLIIACNRFKIQNY